MDKNHLPYIQPQPFYPWDDLTVENERMLSVILANRSVAEEFHVGFSFETPFIDYVNPLVRRVMQSLYQQEWSHVSDASFHGSMLYEVTAGLVGSRAIHASPADIQRIEANIMDYDEISMKKYRNEATSSLIDEGAYTKEVVNSSAERYYPGLTHYALVGAAISRRISIDIMTAIDFAE